MYHLLLPRPKKTRLPTLILLPPPPILYHPRLLQYILPDLVLLALLARPEVRPPEVGPAGAAEDVGDGVQAGDQQAVLLGADGDVGDGAEKVGAPVALFCLFVLFVCLELVLLVVVLVVSEWWWWWR